MKQTTGRLSNFIATMIITALLLTGAVPSFAWGTVSEDDAKAGEAAAQGNKRVVLPAISIDQTDAPKIHGTSAIVIDLDTGTVLYEKNADKVCEPASLTKILNCMVVMETLDPKEEITVPEGVETEGSVIGLVPGEKITVEELIYGMMMESGNDAAEVLGYAAGDGKQDTFSDMMNSLARECGAEHTDYSNPNGLNEDRSHLNYTTARDLALISREAMKNPDFREVVSTAKHTIPATNMSEKRKLLNSNFCLWLKKDTITVKGKEIPYKYEGCNGIKTGFTSDAGYCLVGSAERDGSDFLVVVLGCEEDEQRFQDAILLWDYVFGKYETCTVLGAGETAGVRRIWGGEKRTVEVATDRDLGVTVTKGTAANQEFTTEFVLEEERSEAPITKGQKMGQALVFNSKGRLVGVENLYAQASVAEGGPLSRIGIADEDLPLAAAIAGGVVLLILILCITRSVRKRRARRKQQEQIRGELETMRTAGVGLTAAELSDLTGEEITTPIPKGPERISEEEMNAWTSMEKRNEEGRYRGSRFGGRSQKGGYGKNGAQNGGGASPGQPLDGSTALSDEELFSLLESAEPVSIDQPRHHAKLTEDERNELMNEPPSGKDSADV